MAPLPYIHDGRGSRSNNRTGKTRRLRALATTRSLRCITCEAIKKAAARARTPAALADAAGSPSVPARKASIAHAVLTTCQAQQ
eukprot:scaffold190489_cov29-Tisochrysis_lutea.AAC.2